MAVCPVCHEPIGSAMVDHGVAAHGVVRPPIVMAVVGVLVAASAYLLYLSVSALPDVFRLLGEGELGRLFAASFLMIFLVIGGYGAALGFVALLLWRADRAGRVLAYAACAPIGAATLLGESGDGAYWLVGLAAAAVIAILAFVPEVREWFTGPFAARRAEPSSVVAARALLGWTTYLVGTGAVVHLIVATVASDEILGLLLYGGSAGLLAFSFQGLPTGQATVRVVATAGAALAVVATIVTGETSVSALAIVGPAVAAVVVLWASEEAARHFGTEPIVDLSTFQLGSRAPSNAGWGTSPVASGHHAAPLSPPPRITGTADLADLPPPAAYSPAAPPPPAAGDRLSNLPPPIASAPSDLPPPATSPWADLAPPTNAPSDPGGYLPRSDPAHPTGFPEPPNAALLASLPPPHGAPIQPPPPSPAPVLPPAPLSAAPTVAVPDGNVGAPAEAPHRSLLGYTALSAARAAMFLVAAGGRMTSAGAGSVRFDARGVTLTVLAGDRTRIIVEADDPQAMREVADVAERTIRREDAAFGLSGSHTTSPASGPLPTSPPAGWYDDPYRPNGLRRWDGRGWSADIADR